jgi:hypothetical protein
MTLARVLTAALLFCSLPALPAFTQELQTGKLPAAGKSYSGDMIPPVANFMSAMKEPSAGWRIVPNQSSELDSAATNRIRVDQYRLDPDSPDLLTGRARSQPKTRTLVMGVDGPLDSDVTCYTIRSYVVARDSKDSDSTHMTGYSTCQPVSRYGIKTTVERSVSLER